MTPKSLRTTEIDGPTGALCHSTQRLLAQDEGRPHATRAFIQARWKLSGVYDTAGKAQARN